MTETIQLSKVRSNPYRDEKRNPLDEKRIKQLMESIGATKAKFWKGVYGRKLEDGTVELAFGHHRFEAAKRKGLREVELEIEDLSDSDMLMMMSRENLRGELLVSLETVSAAIRAYGAGEVSLEEVDPKTRKDALRYAPSFMPGQEPSDGPGPSHPYTTDTLARFLGGVYLEPDGTAQNSVRAALGILEMEERKIAGFSERILRTQDEEGVKYLGAKKIIKIISDVKDREVRGKERSESERKAEAQVIAEQLRLEKERKEREKKAKDEHEASVQKEAEAKREANRKEVERLRKEREEKAKALAVKEKTDAISRKALDKKLAQIKKQAEEARKKDAYMPLRREVETLLHKLGVDPSWAEEAKILARKKLTPEDAERVRQAALRRGTWYSETLSNLFLPPLSQTKQIAEYASREEAARRKEKNTKKEKRTPLLAEDAPPLRGC